jgi:adenylosuccinate lyase
MIDRYAAPEMRALWSEQGKFQTWLEVEQAIARAQARLGIIPSAAAREIARASFSVAEIERFEAETRHDVIAFLKSVETSLLRRRNASARVATRYLHFGLTSYDIVDTALSLRCRDSLALILKEAKLVLAQTRRLAVKYRHTPMIGRTHGVHAEPITFGLKCLSWYSETLRNIRRLEATLVDMSVGKVSGAVGSFSQQSPRTEALALAGLGLKPEPVSTQVIPRDRLAGMMAVLALTVSGLERIALEIRNLQRTEIGELAESFRKGQRGSSAMPHKKNPITCEQICGLARVVRANVQVAYENIPLWHERDLTNSSAERVVVPDSLCLTHYLLRKTARMLSDLHVDPERMRSNLEQAQGQYFSQSLMLALVKAGVDKDAAYRLTQELSFTARDKGEDLGQLAARDPRVKRSLKPKELAAALQLPGLLRNVDAIFRRTLR